MKKITSGLYFLYDKGQIVYIGKSKNIFQRIGQHINQNEKEFDTWDYQVIEDEKELSNMEGYLIDVFKPKYNEKKEYNDIFNKNKRTDLDSELYAVLNAYEIIYKYNYIPVNLLDDVFHINGIGFSLMHSEIIPEKALADEKLYGYTSRCIVDKNWILKNIKKLYKEVFK